MTDGRRQAAGSSLGLPDTQMGTREPDSRTRRSSRPPHPPHPLHLPPSVAGRRGRRQSGEPTVMPAYPGATTGLTKAPPEARADLAVKSQTSPAPRVTTPATPTTAPTFSRLRPVLPLSATAVWQSERPPLQALSALEMSPAPTTYRMTPVIAAAPPTPVRIHGPGPGDALAAVSFGAGGGGAVGAAVALGSTLELGAGGGPAAG